MGLTLRANALKTSGSVGCTMSRWMGGAAGRVSGEFTPEAEFPRRLVRSLAPRGIAMVRPTQAKMARRESERKYIVDSERMQLKRMWEVG